MDISTDRCMPPLYQVCLPVILKLGHTRRNQLQVVTTATDRRRGTVAWLMRYTRPDPAGPFFKIRPFKHPQPLISPPLLHYFSHYSFLLNFHNLFLYQPPIIALSQFSKSLKCYLLVETAVVSVYLATEYLCICFSPFLRYVSLIYSHLSCIFVY